MSHDPTKSGISREPMAWLGVAFAAGVAAASVLDAHHSAFAIFATIAAVVAVVLRSRTIAGILVLTAFFLAGVFCFQSEQIGIAENRIKRIYDEGRVSSDDPVEVEGTVYGSPEPMADGSFITIATESLTNHGHPVSASGNVRLYAPTFDSGAASHLDILQLRHGDRVRVACRLEREEAFMNPGVRSRKLLLDQQDVDATSTLKSPLLLEVIERPTTFSPLGSLFDTRQDTIAKLRSQFDSQTSGVLIAAMLGDHHFLDRGTADVFREGGTFHILVISGLHITFLGGIILLIAGAFTKNRLLQFAISAGTLWAYAFAVGAGAPVVRASIMFTLLLLSRALFRNSTLLNALGTCGLLLLVWRPSDLFTPSFQLTCVSVAAIVTTAFPLIEKLRSIGGWIPTSDHPFPADVPRWLRTFCERLYWNDLAWSIESGRNVWSAGLFKVQQIQRFRKLLVYLFEGVLVSLIVQIWMLPLLVVYFHRVSIASVFLNLWVGFWLAVEAIVAALSIAASFLNENLAFGFSAITQFLNGTMMSIPGFIVGAEWTSFRVPVYSDVYSWIYVIYFIPIVVSALITYRWEPFKVMAATSSWPKRAIRVTTAVGIAVILALVIGLHPFSAERPDGRLRIDFLDVGQGDSALVTFPNGQTMLVDGGGRLDYKDSDDDSESFEPDIARIGEFVVSEYLWEHGLDSIDYVIATHADADHVQGLADVVRNFDLGALYFGTVGAHASEIDELLDEAERHDLTPLNLVRGDEIDVAGAKIEVLNPARTDVTDSSDNNNSVVLRISFGKRSFLLTGDIEQNAEFDLVASNMSSLKADVVKVPHHGSRTSSTAPFINAVRPAYAVIPVGRRSNFGHPHADVVERWQKSGSLVITTGERGTITFITDGQELEVSTFR